MDVKQSNNSIKTNNYCPCRWSTLKPKKIPPKTTKKFSEINTIILDKKLGNFTKNLQKDLNKISENYLAENDKLFYPNIQENETSCINFKEKEGNFPRKSQVYDDYYANFLSNLYGEEPHLQREIIKRKTEANVMFNLVHSKTNNKKTFKKVALKPKKMNLSSHKEKEKKVEKDKKVEKEKNKEKKQRNKERSAREKKITKSDKKLYVKSMIVVPTQKMISNSSNLSEKKKFRKHNTLLMNKLKNVKDVIFIENKGKKNIKSAHSCNKNDQKKKKSNEEKIIINNIKKEENIVKNSNLSNNEDQPSEREKEIEKIDISPIIPFNSNSNENGLKNTEYLINSNQIPSAYKTRKHIVISKKHWCFPFLLCFINDIGEDD